MRRQLGPVMDKLEQASRTLVSELRELHGVIAEPALPCEAVDFLQPNCCYNGGYTESLKVAHMAQAFNLPIANGGGSEGVPNGSAQHAASPTPGVALESNVDGSGSWMGRTGLGMNGRSFEAHGVIGAWPSGMGGTRTTWPSAAR